MRRLKAALEKLNLADQLHEAQLPSDLTLRSRQRLAR